MLARRWDRARAGEGQLALVIGEPGIGKSRLIEEFHAWLAETPHTWVEWGASQLLQNTPLHPIAEWGRQRFRADAPAEERLADLEGTLRLIGLDPAEYAPLLAPLVDIPLPPDRGAYFRRKNCGEGNWQQLPPGSGGRGHSRLFSCSRTCTGPTQRRSTSYAPSPTAARKCRCSIGDDPTGVPP